jgi:hypothetical protein
VAVVVVVVLAIAAGVAGLAVAVAVAVAKTPAAAASVDGGAPSGSGGGPAGSGGANVLLSAKYSSAVAATSFNTRKGAVFFGFSFFAIFAAFPLPSLPLDFRFFPDFFTSTAGGGANAINAESSSPTPDATSASFNAGGKSAYVAGSEQVGAAESGERLWVSRWSVVDDYTVVHGSWVMGHGSWFMVQGVMVHGSWFMIRLQVWHSLKVVPSPTSGSVLPCIGRGA